MGKKKATFNTLSETAAKVKDFFRHNIEDQRREDILLKKEDDIIKAAEALTEVGVKDDRITELLCKYWKIRPADARALLLRRRIKNSDSEESFH